MALPAIVMGGVVLTVLPDRPCAMARPSRPDVAGRDVAREQAEREGDERSPCSAR